MKIIKIILLSVLFFLSANVVSAVDFYDMGDIFTHDSTPSIPVRVVGNVTKYACEVLINEEPVDFNLHVFNNVLSYITLTTPLTEGSYTYRITAYNNSETPTISTSPSYALSYSPMLTSVIEAFDYIGDGFRHIADSAEGIMVWGVIFCAIVILLGMIGMFMKALRG